MPHHYTYINQVPYLCQQELSEENKPGLMGVEL